MGEFITLQDRYEKMIAAAPEAVKDAYEQREKKIVSPNKVGAAAVATDGANILTGGSVVQRAMLVSKLLSGGGCGHDHGHGIKHKHDAPPKDPTQEDAPLSEHDAPRM